MMMEILLMAVVLVGALCVVDLLLTVGVIKRLREHTELLAMAGSGSKASLAAGQLVGEFSTVTTDGESLTRNSLQGETLVAFLSPQCKPCNEVLPKFIEYARAIGDRERVLAVIAQDEVEQVAPFLAELEPVARTVVEANSDPVNAAFQVTSYPVKLLVRPSADGVVVTDDNVNLNLRPERGLTASA
jgi:thiol-disulfide isomerase/thioredoxin